MLYSKTGGIIAAAGKKALDSDLKLGSISVIKRLVLTFQQAGVFPIVVVTGYKADDVKYELSNFGVIFLHQDDHEHTDMFDSAKLGFAYLRDKCKQIIFSPVSTPFYLPATLAALMDEDASIAVPAFDGISGHPIKLRSATLESIMAYEGSGGLQSAIDGMEGFRVLDVDDAGILQSIHDSDNLSRHLVAHNKGMIHPFVKLSIERESLFFNSRMKLLLYLIDDTNSVSTACGHMALSYSKAWHMLNTLEKELGYKVVERRRGGSPGGRTRLTEQGQEFLAAYQTFEARVFAYTRTQFNDIFRKPGIIR